MSRGPTSYPLRGGLDLVTPTLEVLAGSMISAANYEANEKGYVSIQGFERVDGRPAPSDASYWILDFDTGTATVSEGDTVTGATSGATGKALIDSVVESGTFGGGNAAGYLVLTAVSGTFQVGEDLQVSAVTKCVSVAQAVSRSADTDDLDATYYQDAIETARALIQTVPGEGVIRGVWSYKGVRYCWRNNVGSTAGVMYKSTAAGWVAVALGRRLPFTSGGVTEITAGQTITGATSGATAVVTRVVTQSGTWAGGDAAGYFIFASQTGTFSAENINVGASLNLATISGDSSAITLPAGGKYECTNRNFYGNSNLKRMYGCNGVGPAFEFDGTVFVPIYTGMTTDTPSHIAVHKKHLFLAFPGGSVQHSSIGNPYMWSPVTGAAEIAIGEDVTGFLEGYGGVLGILGRKTVAVLSGSSTSDWVLSTYSEEVGGLEWTAQIMGTPIYIDNGGLRDLTATQTSAGFNVGTKCPKVFPFFKSKIAAGSRPTASMRVRSKGLYRVFYDDGSGLSVYFGRKVPEAVPFDLGMTVNCACSVEDDDGEILLFGSDDGYVYQMDKGTSFDSDPIQTFIRLPFNHMGRPGFETKFHAAKLELEASPNTEIGMLAEFNYADESVPETEQQNFSISGGGGYWNESNYSEFYWSMPIMDKAYFDIDGIGENMSLLFVSSETYADPHTLTALTIIHSQGKMVRQ